ncbi:Nucleic acid-binding, OB-fold [Sesbania bispinosa]|nr:Nucleic acid-binding, OB-fold [Sesbania bispinosa]
MVGPFDKVSAIHPGKDSWRLRVRVVRLWEMCSIVDPTNPFAIDMVLLDVEGGKIQATIRKPMMKKFRNVISEGEVYTMLNFAVIKNVGSYRACRHEFKLLFSAKTKVFPAQSDVIPTVGLSLMTTEQIAKTNGESNYLFDLMGILTVVSAEKVVETDGRKTRMMEMELMDDKGRMRCTVFGHYVDTLKAFVESGVTPLPVVVVQLFKVRLYKGNVVLQNVNNTSRIMWNPDTPDANEFRNGKVNGGMELASVTNQ